MMKGLAFKALVPGAALAAALAMSAVVALAGPGGFTGDGDGGSTTGGSEAAGAEGGGGETGTGENDCFLTVLNDGAASYIVLEEHISDPDMPEGGKAGNQNALDRICFAAVHGLGVDTTLVTGHGSDAPGKSGDAPGRTGEAPGLSDKGTDTTNSGPGKSEDAPAEPGAPGQAQGQGQEKADTMGVGPGGAQGQSVP